MSAIFRHARADNFSLGDLPEAVAFAHAAGARVHDAFIIADMGAFSLAGRHAPDVDRHVSTQASVCNAEAARAWHDLGASRVVCAREMSLDDIAEA